MNYTFVVLGVLLVFILFVLYKVFTEKKTKLASSSKLGNTTYNYSDLKDPASQKYYIGIWLYVTDISSSGGNIFEVKHSGSQQLELELTSSLDLNVKYDTSRKTINVLKNSFPLQRWTYIIVSVDNKLLDVYVDGKLVTSHNATDLTEFNGSSALHEVNTHTAEIAGFERVPEPMTPANAWSKYMSGNGGNAFTRFLQTWGISLVLTKDDVDQKTIQFPPV